MCKKENNTLQGKISVPIYYCSSGKVECTFLVSDEGNPGILSDGTLKSFAGSPEYSISMKCWSQTLDQSSELYKDLFLWPKKPNRVTIWPIQDRWLRLTYLR